MSALSGFRVIELSSERGAYAGKLLADSGADVILVEPPGGDPTRNYPPFLDDQPGPDRSLWWWHYNTSKRGVMLDLDAAEDQARFKALAASADIIIESEPAGRLASLGLDYEDLKAVRPDLIFVSLTPFGRESINAGVPATDLTLMAGAGPVWSTGYDDHTLPPVRPGVGQAYHTGCHFAAMSALTALFHRLTTGEGQFIDVSLHAASNLATESATYCWILAGLTVQRQTGRHAAPGVTSPTQIQCKDGRWVNAGGVLRQPQEFRTVHAWLHELGLLADFPGADHLERAAARDTALTLDLDGVDPDVTAMFSAGRQAIARIASAVTAYEYFIGFQQRGIPVGIIYSPEEAFEDEHFKARGFQVPVLHEDLGRTFRYPGAPYLFSASPWSISRRAPRLGEHDVDIFGAL
ncbi:MAG: CoA transferase [Phenylobacterium sp.]|uniref:CaiB/BaiF CoA transferase family protein n=1 Tax=Phenylobacterium sp. TaxID=1871053 RepID=UPI0025E69A2A|nr:CoA transferase [Phenylobacterium sp.]MCA3711915.1 CoA transferase [Phenylobacterium sp.]MCA3729595.1 CoA transferase [Phenylobacterium sp.]MCA3745422.1 CoA transferase [Phenylobacterium sp.]MCA3751153.1 CoA transferase [Phenylobacterium sp.]MCA6229721.1 CoA transferase [Phenylobacterium sp.]